MNPAPVPTEWSVGKGGGEHGTEWFLISFTTPVGQQVYWFERDALQAFIDAVGQTVTGIVVPRSPEVVRHIEGLGPDAGR
jgi:hypothetical protein